MKSFGFFALLTCLFALICFAIPDAAAAVIGVETQVIANLPLSPPFLAAKAVTDAGASGGTLWMTILLAVGYLPVFLKWAYDKRKSKVVDAMLDVLWEGCECSMAGISYIRNPTPENLEAAKKEFKDVVIVPKRVLGSLRASR